MCDKKCKNIECDNLIKENRTYCSLTCRNVYVNKHLRDYSKNSKGLSKEDDYNLSPKFCKYCNEKLIYKKRENNFCDNSCSALFNNPNKKGNKYILSEKGKKSLIKSALKLHNLTEEKIENMKIEYYLNPKKCINCENIFSYEKRKKIKKYCSKNCRLDYERKGMTEYQKYKRDASFNFNLSDFPKEFDFDLIKEYGWYKPKNRGDNLNGISRDHIYSIKKGFENNIDTKVISHPANCKLMIHNDNVSKNKKCNITLEELLKKIEKWNKKYNE